eukprot:1178567-Prorocentrum_minimum.AAC.3
MLGIIYYLFEYRGTVRALRRTAIVRQRPKTSVPFGDGLMYTVHNAVAVAPLVVVPGHELNKVAGKRNACLGVHNARAGVTDEVGGHHVIGGEAKEALHLVLAGRLEGGHDLVVGGLLRNAAGEVDHGDVGGGDAEGHAGELAVQLGEHLADGLGSAG